MPPCSSSTGGLRLACLEPRYRYHYRSGWLQNSFAWLSKETTTRKRPIRLFSQSPNQDFFPPRFLFHFSGVTNFWFPSSFFFSQYETGIFIFPSFQGYFSGATNSWFESKKFPRSETGSFFYLVFRYNLLVPVI